MPVTSVALLFVLLIGHAPMLQNLFPGIAILVRQAMTDDVQDGVPHVLLTCGIVIVVGLGDGAFDGFWGY